VRFAAHDFSRTLMVMTSFLHESNDRRDASTVYEDASRAQPRVLVAEDHDDTRFLLRTLMEMRGFSVAEAVDGEQAIHVAVSERPDLILMNMTLPRLDGLDTTRRMRAVATLHDVPIVFLSSHAQPSMRALALDTGGTDYLIKPLDFGELDRVLKKHLGNKGTVKSEQSGEGF
jgi:two-component system cell cycle response regulator DivK